MTNEPLETAYGYLLDPCFQLSNTNGKPLTNGYIECYLHGSRTKYYCYSDFDGTKHPFRIPINSLGTNIVLADVGVPIDVYVYNQFGGLQMSRYNVVAGSGVAGGGGTPADPIDAQYWLGNDGETVSVSGGSAGRDLPLPTTPDSNEAFVKYIQNDHIVITEGVYLVQAVVDFRQDDQDLENTIKNLKITTGLSDTEDVVFERDEAGHDASDNIHSLKISFIRHAIEESTDDICIHVISPVDLQLANIRKLSIVKLQTAGYGSDIGDVLTEDDLTLNEQGYVTEIAEHPIAGGSGSTYQAGQYIDITNDTISVSGIYPDSYLTSADLNGYATETWVSGQGYMKNLFTAVYGITTYADIGEAVRNEKIVYCAVPFGQNFRMAFLAYQQYGGTVVPFYEFQYYRSNERGGDDTIFVYKIFPDDHWETEERTAACPSDWNATSGKAYIRNKPNLSIYATTSGMEEYVTEQTSAFITSADLPDLSGYATETWVQNQGYITSIPSEYVTDTEMSNYVTEQTSAFITSADVPAQVQSDWTEVDSGALDYIKNKPTEWSLDAIAPLYIVDDVSGSRIGVSGMSNYVTTSAMQDYVSQETSAFVTSADVSSALGSYATKQYVSSVAQGITGWAEGEFYPLSNPSHFITSADVTQYTAGSGIEITSGAISAKVDGTSISVNASGQLQAIGGGGGGGGMLPPIDDNTVRCRFAAGYTPSMGRDGNVCVDAANNIWDITDNTGWSHRFNNNQNLLEVLGARLVSITDGYINGMFDSCSYLTRAVDITLSNDPNIGNIVPTEMFKSCGSLEYVHFKECTLSDNANYMFYFCQKLRKVDGLSLANLYETEYMFAQCINLERGYTGSYDSIMNMAHMYDGCSNMNFAGWSLSMYNAYTTSHMFDWCRSLLIIPEIGLDTSSPEPSKDVSYMFRGCNNVASGMKKAYDKLIYGGATYTGCFEDCAIMSYGGQQERLQIPAAWGGDGA